LAWKFVECDLCGALALRQIKVRWGNILSLETLAVRGLMSLKLTFLGGAGTVSAIAPSVHGAAQSLRINFIPRQTSALSQSR
jgi:hypothetical protein